MTGGSISGVFAGMWLGDYATIKYSQPEEGCPPPVNQPPGVNAGPDQTITLPGSTYLVGTVSDDGLPNPPWAVTTTWSKVSGPGTVTFGNAAAVNTTAKLSVAGSYVLRLTANDSALQASDDAAYGQFGGYSTSLRASMPDRIRRSHYRVSESGWDGKR